MLTELKKNLLNDGVVIPGASSGADRGAEA